MRLASISASAAAAAEIQLCEIVPDFDVNEVGSFNLRGADLGNQDDNSCNNTEINNFFNNADEDDDDSNPADGSNVAVNMQRDNNQQKNVYNIFKY